jgi:bifunctional UDP-N-acetylglucosamine pyrophosphorylase/glucosamine-1-phosphate N-acetyltransferase
MIRYVVDAALAVLNDVVVVIGHQAEGVRKALEFYPMLRFAVQAEQLGTGHAVMCAMPQVPASIQDVVVLCGDTPLIKPATVRALIDKHKASESDLSLLTTTLREPFGYGRVVLDAQGRPLRIVEESDASAQEKQIALVNTGTYCINKGFLKRGLAGLDDDNAQGEFYLTDVLARAYQEGRPAVLLEVADSMEVLGVNTRQELARAEEVVLSRPQGSGPESS